ncbi:MAG: thioredoxin family protein [Gammaproteobacteria bacterium]
MKHSLFFMIILLTFSVTAEEYEYDPNADPQQLLLESVEKASSENKLILIVFGSDWCPDCRSFNKKLSIDPLSKTISNNFIVMHVDVGEWDRNIPFTEKFGKPIGEGIPSIAILGDDQTLYYVAEAGEFASARKSKVISINDWFVSIESKIRKLIADTDTEASR